MLSIHVSTCVLTGRRSRLLDLLLEINNSPQIPPERRIDVSLEPPSDPDLPVLPIDREHALRKQLALKKLEDLLANVPHASYAAFNETHDDFTKDLLAYDGDPHPATFLSPDELDVYIHGVDRSIGLTSPSLPPAAHLRPHTAMHPQLKNPTSVTNWLRKHKPNIFLQDSEGHHGDADDGEGGHTGGGRKSRGGARGERGGRGGTRGKKANAAARVAAAAAAADKADYDANTVAEGDGEAGGTPAGRGGKRKRDDDPGYRPKGSSGRPTKKKRKSDMDGTPTVRKSKKDSLPAASRDDGE